GADTFHTDWDSTFGDYLNNTAGVDLDVSFEVVALEFEDVVQAYDEQAIDFLFANPGMISCAQAAVGARPILALRNIRRGYELNEFGGLIFTRADRDDISSIDDLAGKKIEAVSTVGLGAFQLQWDYVTQQGVRLFVDCEQVIFSYNQKDIVRDVVAGVADVGFVRTDLIDQMVESGDINAADIKVLDPKVIEGFPFDVTTGLVPEWHIAALMHVPDAVVAAVATALSQISSTDPEAVAGGYSKFDPAHSLVSLLRLQQNLGIIDQATGRCLEAESISDAITCPDGYVKAGDEEIAAGCEDAGLPCPDGYDCICRPCIEVPGHRIHLEFAGNECSKNAVCKTAYEGEAFNLTIVDDWFHARSQLGVVSLSTVEVRLKTAGTTLCYSQGMEPITCGEPPVITTAAQAFNVTIPVEPGQAIVQVLADGYDIETSPFVLQGQKRPCKENTLRSVTDCHNNGTRTITFSYAPEVLELCQGWKPLPSPSYSVDCGGHINYMSPVGLFMTILASVGVTFCLLLSLWTIIKRNHAVVKRAQFEAMLLITISAAVACIPTLLHLGHPTTSSCALIPILTYLSLTAFSSAMTSKLYRVWKLTGGKLRKTKVPASVVLKLVACALGLASVLLALWMALLFPHPEPFEYSDHGFTGLEGEWCSTGQPWPTLLRCYLVVILGGGYYFSSKTGSRGDVVRDLAGVTELQQAMGSVTLILVTVILTLTVAGVEEHRAEAVFDSVIVICMVISLYQLFRPK
ncbi:unnamed protein product, partial [Chrysoparadoxa australica]